MGLRGEQRTVLTRGVEMPAIARSYPAAHTYTKRCVGWKVTAGILAQVLTRPFTDSEQINWAC